MASCKAREIGLHGFDADAFIVDSVAQCWLALRRFNGTVPVMAYLHRVVVNLTRDRLQSMAAAGRRAAVAVEVSVRVNECLVADAPVLMSQLSPGQSSRLNLLAYGAKACGDKHQRDVWRKENETVIRAARKIFSDYATAT